MRPYLGIVTTHPVQYHTPWFRHLAERYRLLVLYAHRQTATEQGEAGFDTAFDWDVDLLDGYPSRWLRNVARRPGGGAFFGYDAPDLGKIVEDEGFDAVLVFGWNYKAALQAVAACLRRRVPVLMRGDSQLETARSAVVRAAKWPVYRALLPRVGHLYVGERNRRYLGHYGVPDERLFFAPHFVDNDYFSEGARRARAQGEHVAVRRALGIPEGAFVCVYVGKLLPKKRVGDLLRACAASAAGDAADAFHVVVVGDGPERPGLEALAEKAPDLVHFVGFKNQSELPAIYAACDALVLPSTAEETWGLVVNEAMACGVPAVVSDAVGCAPDLIDPGSTGYTYPVGDVRALGGAIREMRALCRSRPEDIASALGTKRSTYSVERATEGVGTALRALSATC